MHKLLDKINHTTVEMKDMQPGFPDSEKIVLDSLRELSQDILKKTHETEMNAVSGSIEQIGARAAMFIPKIIIPNNAIADNLYQGVIRGQNERDLQKTRLNWECDKLSKKINHMNTLEVFEFLETFSKRDLYSIGAPELRYIRQIPVIVKKIPIVVEPVPIDAGKTSLKELK